MAYIKRMDSGGNGWSLDGERQSNARNAQVRRDISKALSQGSGSIVRRCCPRVRGSTVVVDFLFSTVSV